MSGQGSVRDRYAAGVGLIETMRWEPAQGFVRLARHLARLAGSAGALGIPHDPSKIAQALDKAAGGGTPMRVRLELRHDGKVEATASAFVPTPPDALWKLRIASASLDAGDPLLRHKTTRREAYDAARAEFSREDVDEVLLLNQRGEVCEGTITSVFARLGDGVLVTPPLSCGLLAGVLRAEMLACGDAVERVLLPADLARARAIHVGNSLRGLIRCRLDRTG